jgi:hypothetical protein
MARVGSDNVVVVGFDNVCSPGAAWDESVASELGDPGAGTWEQMPNLPSPRDRFALLPLSDGRALVIGGTSAEDENGPRSYSSTYWFDPASRAWSKAALLNSARSDPAGAVLAEGQLLTAGGYYADPQGKPPLRMLDGSEVFDPLAGRWTRTGSLEQARYGAPAVTLADGRVLIVGGWPSVKDGPAPLSGNAMPLASAELYDPSTGRWSPAGKLKVARTNFALVPLMDGGALVAGGTVFLDQGEFGYSAEPTASTERFDPTTGTWSPGGDMALAAADRTGITLADGHVLVAGGDITVSEVDLDVTPSALTADAEIYDPAARRWKVTTSLPRPRSGASVVLLEDGSVLLAGGIKAFGSPGDTPSCPVPEPEAMRYVPGS